MTPRRVFFLRQLPAKYAVVAVPVEAIDGLRAELETLNPGDEARRQCVVPLLVAVALARQEDEGSVLLVLDTEGLGLLADVVGELPASHSVRREVAPALRAAAEFRPGRGAYWRRCRKPRKSDRDAEQ